MTAEALLSGGVDYRSQYQGVTSRATADGTSDVCVQKEKHTTTSLLNLLPNTKRGKPGRNARQLRSFYPFEAPPREFHSSVFVNRCPSHTDLSVGRRFDHFVAEAFSIERQVLFFVWPRNTNKIMTGFSFFSNVRLQSSNISSRAIEKWFKAVFKNLILKHDFGRTLTEFSTFYTWKSFNLFRLSAPCWLELNENTRNKHRHLILCNLVLLFCDFCFFFSFAYFNP